MTSISIDRRQNRSVALAVVQLTCALALVVLASAAAWTNHGARSRSALAADGGAGFGPIALVFSALLLALALLRLLGRTRVLPGLGVDQLTVICGATVLIVSFAFIVGWLRAVHRGTGWGVIVAIAIAWCIPHIALVSLSSQAPERSVRPLPSSRIAPLSLLTIVAGAGTALAPMMTWFRIGGHSISGYHGGWHLISKAPIHSGPRLTFILAVVGATTVAVGALRLRRRGLADPGPRLIVGHVLLLLGIVATVLPLATAISIARIDGVDTGLGVGLAVAGGVLLVGVAVDELRSREALPA